MPPSYVSADTKLQKKAGIESLLRAENFGKSYDVKESARTPEQNSKISHLNMKVIANKVKN